MEVSCAQEGTLAGSGVPATRAHTVWAISGTSRALVRLHQVFLEVRLCVPILLGFALQCHLPLRLLFVASS
jgi:hypothetical protein